MGLGRAANDPEVRELSEKTEIDAVAQSIQENLPPA
jgi:hypothetical protein